MAGGSMARNAKKQVQTTEQLWMAAEAGDPAAMWAYALMRLNLQQPPPGTPNPLAGDVQFIYTFCSSQPCRTMHDFVQLGFNQAEGAAPLVEGHPIEHPETVASAIRIGNPVRWEDAMAAATDSREK